MKWTKFKVKTITEAEDIIISTLYDIGFEGAQIEDKVPLTAWEKEQMFVDILPDGPEDDGVAYLSFFVEEEEGALVLPPGQTFLKLLPRHGAQFTGRPGRRGRGSVAGLFNKSVTYAPFSRNIWQNKSASLLVMFG